MDCECEFHDSHLIPSSSGCPLVIRAGARGLCRCGSCRDSGEVDLESLLWVSSSSPIDIFDLVARSVDEALDVSHGELEFGGDLVDAVLAVHESERARGGAIEVCGGVARGVGGAGCGVVCAVGGGRPGELEARSGRRNRRGRGTRVPVRGALGSLGLVRGGVLVVAVRFSVRDGEAVDAREDAVDGAERDLPTQPQEACSFLTRISGCAFK